MLKRKIFYTFILMALLAVGFSANAQDDLIQVTQWADDAEASSQYGEDSWSADQATGRPDVRACEDNVEAWASATYDGEEYLTLFFDDEVIPTQVNIFQTLSTGAIVGLELIPDDNDEDPRFFTLEDPSDECPSILSVDLPNNMPETQGVTIYFNMELVGNWNEIDAVELVGLVEGDEDDEEESSIEEDRYDEFEVFSVDATPLKIIPGDEESEDEDRDDDADYDVEWGRDIQCRDGGGIDDGVEVTIVQQRTGNQYRITAIGIDGFDPVLGVMLTGEYNNALCNDDDSEAATYGANLPTTGAVSPADTSSQVIFNLNSGNAFENVSIVVGGFDGASGEYVLIIEGMYASSADGAGDPMSLAISPALIESGVDPSAYMVSVVGAFDPLMQLVDGDYEVITDNDGVNVLCDDAGNSSLCWGESSSLVGAFLSRSGNRQLGGGSLDSMLTLETDPSLAGFFYNFLMTSYGTTEGDYLVAFHLGIAPEE